VSVRASQCADFFGCVCGEHLQTDSQSSICADDDTVDRVYGLGDDSGFFHPFYLSVLYVFFRFAFCCSSTCDNLPSCFSPMVSLCFVSPSFLIGFYLMLVLFGRHQHIMLLFYFLAFLVAQDDTQSVYIPHPQGILSFQHKNFFHLACRCGCDIPS